MNTKFENTVERPLRLMLQRELLETKHPAPEPAPCGKTTTGECCSQCRARKPAPAKP